MFISKRCDCFSKNGLCCKSVKDVEKLSKDLSLLSVKSRLDILFHLKDKSHCVCDLMSHTDKSQSLISHHLSDLTGAGFIGSKREGKYMNYYLTKKGHQFLDALFVLLNERKGGGKDYGRR